MYRLIKRARLKRIDNNMSSAICKENMKSCCQGKARLTEKNDHFGYGIGGTKMARSGKFGEIHAQWSQRRHVLVSVKIARRFRKMEGVE